MGLSTVVAELTGVERKLQIEGKCVKRFTLKEDGSVDESGSTDSLLRVSQDMVSSLKGVKLIHDEIASAHDKDRRQYWSVVRDYLNDEEWITEAKELPIVASSNTFVASKSFTLKTIITSTTRHYF